MNADNPSILSESLRLPARDGYSLGATRYHAPRPVAQLLVAGATGVPQGFYRRFAEHAARRGFETLTLDYRGVGQSKPDSLRGFEMDYLDWAHLDLAAAVDLHLDGQRPLFMVGHSFGGHAFGLLPNHERVAGFYTFGTGAGWHGWMPRLEQVRVLAMWRLIGPLMTRYKGYLAWSKLGMGEDLPMGVYRKWKRWCGYPRYFFEDPQLPDLAARFAEVDTPIVAANALDDLWAPPRSRDAFMAAYSNAPYQARDIQVQDGRLGPIGHMGYFRPAAQVLWDEALDWFAELQARQQAA
ncbi:alpha/beta fold hydrolase [Pseudomonas benzenivorans]|uniref:Alpha/beta fold hydrolase n=1 Tax=Pseudomonas benzenivorans TaxID=556533 RepID=A0ABZ0PU74_9PSED|nr:alpha/beta fold hydrolase [Pseudomonas benzenivorans]WPC04739.1 alpha/beta fold hydrolase [Pseudomonas benzenivorans]